MAYKLPVGEVLNEAFQFGLHRWGAVIRFGWAPMLAGVLIFAAAFVLVFKVEMFDSASSVQSINAIGDYLRVPVAGAVIIFTLASIAFFVLFSGFMASIYRLVALGEDRPGIFHLRLDGPAWRVFSAYMILTLINYAVMGGALLAALAVSGQSAGDVFGALRDFFAFAISSAESGADPDPAAMEPLLAPLGAFGLMFLFSIIPLIYVNIKLTPLLAGSAAENRILLFGSFALTKGNFWSIFGVILLLILLMIVVSIVFQLAVGVFDLLSGFLLKMGGGLAIVGGVFSLIVFAATIFYQAFVYGVQFSTQAIIYRRLKTGQ